MGPDRRLRVAVLWKQLAGYSTACFRALADTGVDIHLIYRAAEDTAPFDDTLLSRGIAGHHWGTAPDGARIRESLFTFDPDALLIMSWDVGAYRSIARAMQGRTLRILCMDNQWHGAPKQWGGVLMSRLVIRPAYDVAFLPGDRQADFARRLGFHDSRILWGLYACDHDAFDPERHSHALPQPRAFLFAGQVVHRKGVDILASAYLRYRRLVDDPWPLIICGTGPLTSTLDDIPGVDLRGFVQPLHLPLIFRSAACLVLPSRFEPWGVVIHEAVSAGLAVICTTLCGASTRLVLDGYNGVVIPTNDVSALVRALVVISTKDPSSLDAMRTRSLDLSRQFTPQRWANYLVDGIGRLRVAVGLVAHEAT